ncbi:hypothetical protein CMT74_06145 [Elizabethkingia anophelis]|nr:hypothetical protein [Elizabethkingia anophelis]
MQFCIYFYGNLNTHKKTYASMKVLYKIDNVLVILIFLITFYISVIGGIALFILYILFKSEFSSISFIYIIFIFSLIAFTQYSTPKLGDYDMVRYYTIYDILADTNWKMAIAVIFRLGDIFFYFIEFLLTRIFPHDPRMMAFFFTFVISLNNYFAINYFLIFINGKKFSYNKLYIVLYFLSFFLILNYPNMTNAYRQFFAMSLFFLAISRKLLGKKYIFLIILSIFSHWSMLIYLIIFILVKFLKNNTKFVLIGAVIINIFINYLLPVIPFFGEKISAYTSGEEILGIDKAAITVNILVQILLLCYIYKRRIKFYDYFSLLLTLLSYSIIFLTNSTIITRHFFFVTNFILVVVLFANILYNKNREIGRVKYNIYYTIIIALTMFLNIKQLYYGNFNYLFLSKKLYYSSAFEILTTPFPYEIIR